MFLLHAQNLCLIGNKSHNNNLGGVYIFMSISLKLELLIIGNKTSNPVDFKFTRFSCTNDPVLEILGPIALISSGSSDESELPLLVCTMFGNR